VAADSFGNILRQNREAQHIDVLVASSRLHIRTDILNAIENSDIKRMPPRSYSRNMISAYARYLGLNPQPLIDDYENQVYAGEISKERNTSGGRRSSVSFTSHKSENFRTARALREERFADQSNAGNSNGRQTVTMYDEETTRRQSRSFDDRNESESRTPRVRSSRKNRSNESQRTTKNLNSRTNEKQSFRKSTHSSVRAGKYNNAVVGETKKNKIVGIVVIVAIIALVVFGITRIVSCTSGSATKTTTSGVTVSGLTDPENKGISTTTQTTTTPIMPTAAVFSYEIPRDTSAYIEVYIDSKMEDSGTFDGPAHDTFDVTGTLRFVTTNPSGVKCTLGGKVVELTEISDNKGVFEYSVKYEDYLKSWKEENNVQ